MINLHSSVHLMRSCETDSRQSQSERSHRSQSQWTHRGLRQLGAENPCVKPGYETCATWHSVRTT